MDVQTGALTIPEFCKTYRVGRSFAYAQIRAGHLRACKAGSRTLIRLKDAEAWLASLEPARGTEAADAAP